MPKARAGARLPKQCVMQQAGCLGRSAIAAAAKSRQRLLRLVSGALRVARQSERGTLLHETAGRRCCDHDDGDDDDDDSRAPTVEAQAKFYAWPFSTRTRVERGHY